MDDQILDRPMIDIVARVRARSVSATAVAEAAIARAEAAQPRLNCFFEIEAEAALEAAHGIERCLDDGRDAGPLAGAPLAHKDLYYRRGKITSFGAALFRDHRAAIDSTALSRLAKAGALNLGRLHMTELANGSTGHNVHFGHCRNPWNPAYAPGGSSSGNGAATAARVIAGGLGSDAGGSIRIPASMCGLVGVRPTQTRVTRHGTLPLSFSVDCCGPITRSVRDAARLLSVVAGHDPADATSSRRPVPDFEAACGRSVAGLKIGIPTGYYDEAVDPEVADAITAARADLKALGCDLVSVPMPDHEAINQLWNLIQLAEVAAAHARFLSRHRDAYSPPIRRRIETGLFIPAADYIRASARRGELIEEFVHNIFSRCDLLHTPTLPLTPPTLADSEAGDDPAGPARELDLAAWHALILRISGFTRPASFLGLPAMSLAAGFTGNGLPIGMQLIARPFDEAVLFRVGAAYEPLHAWHERSPPGYGPAA